MDHLFTKYKGGIMIMLLKVLIIKRLLTKKVIGYWLLVIGYWLFKSFRVTNLRFRPLNSPIERFIYNRITFRKFLEAF
jgi:hypothetical protein